MVVPTIGLRKKMKFYLAIETSRMIHIERCDRNDGDDFISFFLVDLNKIQRLHLHII